MFDACMMSRCSQSSLNTIRIMGGRVCIGHIFLSWETKMLTRIGLRITKNWKTVFGQAILFSAIIAVWPFDDSVTGSHRLRLMLAASLGALIAACVVADSD